MCRVFFIGNVLPYEYGHFNHTLFTILLGQSLLSLASIIAEYSLLLPLRRCASQEDHLCDRLLQSIASWGTENGPGLAALATQFGASTRAQGRERDGVGARRAHLVKRAGVEVLEAIAVRTLTY
jgi:hypothetical protein